MNLRSKRSLLVGWAATLAILGSMIIGAASAHAATLRRASSLGASGVDGQDTFFTGYYDFGAGSTVDNTIKLANPTSIGGNICAMIYVFDTREEMGACCGCLLTPNQIRYGSIKSMITNPWIGRTIPTQGVINVVSAPPNNGTQCAPTLAYTPTPTINGWITHAATISGISSLTEVPLTKNGDADPVEGGNLVGLCAAIVGNGSGAGQCICPTSDEAGIP
jgi:hypothetical protein